MTVLDKICADKRDHIRVSETNMPLTSIKSLIQETPITRGFIKNILDQKRNNSPALIAEIKKASPSKGLIREDFNPADLARQYEQGGATCLSILTDIPYFQGHDEFVFQAKEACSLPILRKDFMLEPYQIYESRALGADCILLIMAALDDSQAAELYNLARSLNLDVLVEVHDKEELESALRFDPQMIGVNNRNLKTMEVSLQTSFDLLKNIPPHIIKVAESGIHESQDLQALHKAGYDVFLVGESLMRQNNVVTATQNILKQT